jgi:hypothetical protein
MCMNGCARLLLVVFAASPVLAKRATRPATAKPAPAATAKPAPAATAKPAPAKEPDPGPQCTAKIVVGNPVNRNTDKVKVAEQAVTADPPVQLYGVTVQKGALHGHTLYELWMVADAAKPEKIVRYAGVDPDTEGGAYKFQDGPCAGARFPQISGIAAGPDGSIIVTDRLANAVVRVDGPGTSACTAKMLVGSGPGARVSPAGLNPGDKDGQGTAARLSYPKNPAVDDKGNIYIIDNNNKLKRISGDAVTTVGTLPADSAYNYSGMTFLKGNLYVTFLQGLKNSVLEVDPSSGKTRAVLEGNGKMYPPLDSSVVPGLGAITTDGNLLYITGRSLIWSLATDGKLTLVAGNGKDEWGRKEDPLAARPALTSALPGNASHVAMTWLAGSGLLFRGRAGYANNSIIMQISCP